MDPLFKRGECMAENRESVAVSQFYPDVKEMWEKELSFPKWNIPNKKNTLKINK